jgi:RNA polymerase sigma factor (sigma-70 family)
MESENKQWDLADQDLNLWLNEDKHESDLPFSDILRSTYLAFRQKEIRRIFNFCKKAFEHHHQVKQQEAKQESSIRFKKFNKDFQIKGLAEELIKEFDVPYYRKSSYSKKEIDDWTRKENEKIIKGIIDGDQNIFNDLYEFEFPKVVELVIQNSGTIDMAKDIFQDALVIFIEKVYAKKLDLTCTVSTYLYSICRFLWMDQLRQNKREKPISDNSTYLIADITIAGFDNSPDIYEKVNTAIESLGNPCKQLLESYYYKNLSWDEIATNLGYANSSSARNQKYKCLERIRKTVDIAVE